MLAGAPGAPRLLTAWRDAGAAPLCNLSALHGSATEAAAQRLQLASDAAYRWLYQPLAARERLAEWPWRGRSRMPPRDEAAEAAPAGAATARVPPQGHWLARCSYLQAVDALWCPVQSDANEWVV